MASPTRPNTASTPAQATRPSSGSRTMAGGLRALTGGRHVRPRTRGGDTLGRFSSNKFGVVLKTCTPDDLRAAADRFLAAVREDVVQTAHGPVAASVTIGGVAAPRHARTVGEVLAHAQ